MLTVKYTYDVLLTLFILYEACRRFDAGIAAQGSFSPKIDFPLVPVASAALPNGNVLVWSGDAVDTFAPPDKQTGTTFFAVFDSENDSVGPLQTVSLNHDMFCPGIAIQPNGDVVVVGGSAFGDGAASTSIWNGAWSQGPQLNIARGYNTAVTMTSGDVRLPTRKLPVHYVAGAQLLCCSADQCWHTRTCIELIDTGTMYCVQCCMLTRW